VHLAQGVEKLRLEADVAGPGGQRQCTAQAGARLPGLPGLELGHAEVAQDVGGPRVVADLPGDGQRLLVEAGGAGMLALAAAAAPR
jgi:hypothetical protein